VGTGRLARDRLGNARRNFRHGPVSHGSKAEETGVGGRGGRLAARRITSSAGGSDGQLNPISFNIMNLIPIFGLGLAILAESVGAQGTLALTSASGYRPRITLDGVNAGTNIKVELLVAGATALTYASSQLAVEPFAVNLRGVNAGLFSQGLVVVAGVAPGTTADVTIRAWDSTSGSTYLTATTKDSTRFSYVLGGVGDPPSLPGLIVAPSRYNGLSLITSTPICLPEQSNLPEPGTWALSALGLGGLLLFRRF